MATLGRLAALLTVAVMTSACSGEPSVDGAEPEGAPSPRLGEFRVSDMLDEVPAEVRTAGESFTLYTGDVTRASELAGLERPTDPAQAGGWVSNLGGVGIADGRPPVAFVPLDVPLAGTSPANLVQEELGWSVVDVGRFVSYRIAVNASTLIASGPFDQSTLAGVRQMSGRIRSAGQAADLDDELDQATAARPLGVPLRMAVEGGWLVASTYTSVVQTWLAGPSRTLADDPLLASFAAILDDADCYAAVIVTAAEDGPERLPAFVLEALGITPADFPAFDTYAIGWSFQQGRPAITVVYHAAVGASVREVRARIADRWRSRDYRGQRLSDVIDLDEIAVDGRNVVVTMTPTDTADPGTVFRLHERQDVPFLSSSS